MLDIIKDRRQKGFTIIEVVIVLAIAGLIFLVVFLAVPQLQASRRDSQRRSDAARIGAALESYAANSAGSYPATGALPTDIITASSAPDASGNALNDPETGNAYAYVANAGLTAPVDPPNYTYVQGGTCGANGVISGSGGSRVFAVAIGLEGGGAACYDVQ